MYDYEYTRNFLAFPCLKVISDIVHNYSYE